ncbi:IS30 family transposase [Streptomyces sp. NPDC050842]|uniref:IS30 family transposase n=1 Tax=Streptomyces sp. NPDC050842 TaxID=3365636 RepID=UPI00379C803D
MRTRGQPAPRGRPSGGQGGSSTSSPLSPNSWRWGGIASPARSAPRRLPARVHDPLARPTTGRARQLRRTLTWDRGREITEHQTITAETRMPIYLCKPRSPCQRGTNENTNRLLRQYLPKGADLRTFRQADLDAIAHELNQRPRKTHGYRTPAEVYADLLNSGDALTA